MLEKPEQGNIRSEDIEIVKNKKALKDLEMTGQTRNPQGLLTVKMWNTNIISIE